ncbi:uncharacterized protein EV422DRAFT_565137 [Fimicolochytrium jonesii]|uniref:uncharacterized protein n=1 Tax=Fimicolochytrium jonesii TaxID=1396493 RepID=UPI0022FEE8EE|nr:uncharacterized protein EV422DRAFT_565137 [Fimicolochytrium jonesii]KAI8824446.1 hypothetical protein EV422DRAFT_565137 [Fimicolochytrium jonesii]
MVFDLPPIGTEERHLHDIKEIEALARGVLDVQACPDRNLCEGFERLVELAGTRDFLMGAAQLAHYTNHIKCLREDRYHLGYVAPWEFVHKIKYTFIGLDKQLATFLASVSSSFLNGLTATASATVPMVLEELSKLDRRDTVEALRSFKEFMDLIHIPKNPAEVEFDTSEVIRMGLHREGFKMFPPSDDEGLGLRDEFEEPHLSSYEQLPSYFDTYGKSSKSMGVFVRFVASGQISAGVAQRSSAAEAATSSKYGSSQKAEASRVVAQQLAGVSTAASTVNRASIAPAVEVSFPSSSPRRHIAGNRTAESRTTIPVRRRPKGRPPHAAGSNAGYTPVSGAFSDDVHYSTPNVLHYEIQEVTDWVQAARDAGYPPLSDSRDTTTPRIVPPSIHRTKASPRTNTAYHSSGPRTNHITPPHAGRGSNTAGPSRRPVRVPEPPATPSPPRRLRQPSNYTLHTSMATPTYPSAGFALPLDIHHPQYHMNYYMPATFANNAYPVYTTATNYCNTYLTQVSPSPSAGTDYAYCQSTPTSPYGFATYSDSFAMSNGCVPTQHILAPPQKRKGGPTGAASDLGSSSVPVKKRAVKRSRTSNPATSVRAH